MVYEPHEDSFLLQSNLAKHCQGIVLDMGTGSGIQALSAAKMVEGVTAVDIDPEAVAFVRELVKQDGITNIEVIESDLFEKVDGEFDTILFNTPYLPEDGEPDPALDGGALGYEIVIRFLSEAKGHLAPEGIILLVISTLTNPLKVEQEAKKLGYSFKIIDEEKVPFETLYLYKLTK
ncbi:MAG: HemK2/MTQ2 family protein methyltransferase [Candidatus Woesearchaeota archaeon]